MARLEKAAVLLGRWNCSVADPCVVLGVVLANGSRISRLRRFSNFYVAFPIYSKVAFS